MARDYTVENVGINITSSAEVAISSIQKLSRVLTTANKKFEKMNIELAKIKGSNSAIASIIETSSSVKEIVKDAPKAVKEIDRIGASINRAKGKNIFSQMAGGLFSLSFLRQVARFLQRSATEMINFAENYNLFVVSMGEGKEEALEFQNAMNKALSTNMSQTMRYQGFFQNLTTALGATNEQGLLLSETLTMLTYDMASLFNWSPDIAYQRLQAGVVGQTKPLRYAGVDVTEQTIQPILDELGIDRSVKQLTQYEKVLLRMIAILRQTGNAQGDFARTIESPANQIRIFTDQTKELFRWIGGTFIGLFSKVLPYINGFVMALVQVFKMLSYLVGFTEDDFDFMNGDGGEQFEEYEENVNGANEAVKKLTGNLRKFDEINNISMRNDAGAGGVGSDVDKLWNTLKNEANYFDRTFENIQNKAKDIKLAIMDWLSIFFELNDEGDEFTGKITSAGTALLILGGAFVIAGFLGTVAKFVTAVGTINTALTGGAVVSATTGATGGAVLGVTLLTGAIVALGTVLASATIIGGLTWFDKIKEKIQGNIHDFSVMETWIIKIAGLLGGIDTSPLTDIISSHNKQLEGGNYTLSDEYKARELENRLLILTGQEGLFKNTGKEATDKYETITLVLDHTTVGKVVKKTEDNGYPTIQW